MDSFVDALGPGCKHQILGFILDDVVNKVMEGGVRQYTENIYKKLIKDVTFLLNKRTMNFA